MRQIFIITFLLVISACSELPSELNYNHIDAFFLDPHLHSARSSDWGHHGLAHVDGSIQSLRDEAQMRQIDQIWLTDHPDGYSSNRPEPSFVSDDNVKDAIEICETDTYCFNETMLKNGTLHRSVVNAWTGIDDFIIDSIQGVEVITTGGDIREPRTSLDQAIELIQKGHKVSFLGSSNNHLGLAGDGGLTAIHKGLRLGLEDSLMANNTTAIRSKLYTMFFTKVTSTLGLIQYPLEKINNVDYVLVTVYDSSVVYKYLKQKENEIVLDNNALGQFVMCKNNKDLLAVTSPIYKL